MRERIRVYGSAGGPTPEQAAQAARQCVEQGFTALKTTPFPDPVRPIESPAGIERVISHIAAMREAVGPAIDIAIDFHRATSPALAKVLLRELEPLKPLFVEEPTRSTDNIGPLLELTRSTSIPIATGERCATRWGLPRIVRAQGRSHRPTRYPPLRRHPRNEENRRPSRSPRDHCRTPQRRRPPRHRRLRPRDGRYALTSSSWNTAVAAAKGFSPTPCKCRMDLWNCPRGPGLGVEINPDGSRGGYSSRPLAAADDAPPPRGRLLLGFLVAKKTSNSPLNFDTQPWPLILWHRNEMEVKMESSPADTRTPIGTQVGLGWLNLAGLLAILAFLWNLNSDIAELGERVARIEGLIEGSRGALVSKTKPE